MRLFQSVPVRSPNSRQTVGRSPFRAKLRSECIGCVCRAKKRSSKPGGSCIYVDFRFELAVMAEAERLVLADGGVQNLIDIVASDDNCAVVIECTIIWRGIQGL